MFSQITLCLHAARGPMVEAHRALVKRLALRRIKHVDIGLGWFGIGDDQAHSRSARRNFGHAIKSGPQPVVFDARFFLVVRTHRAQESAIGDAAPIENIAAGIDHEIHILQAKPGALENV